MAKVRYSELKLVQALGGMHSHGLYKELYLFISCSKYVKTPEKCLVSDTVHIIFMEVFQ